MSYLAILKRGHFSKLWTAQILSLVAQNLLNFSLIIRMFDLTQGTSYANLAVALLILSFGIPSVLFAAAAGAYVDNWDRKRVLVVSNLLRAVLVLGYLVVDHNLFATLGLTFAISTITQFFAPAESASIPRLVPRTYLVNANAMFISTFYATFVIGYSAAAPIINVFGNHSPYILGSAMFGVATILTVLLPKLGEGHVHHGTFLQLLDKTRRSLVDSQRKIIHNVGLWVPIVQLMLIQIIVSVVLALAPALSLALLKRPLQEVSYFLIVPIALGMIGGVVMVSPLSRWIPKLRLIKIGLFFAGATLTGIGLTGLLYRQINGHVIATTTHIGWIVAGLVLILGFMNSVVSISAQTLLHENSSDDIRGKVFGALNTMINLAATLPVLVAGILADAFSPTEVVDATGLIVLVLAILQIWLVRFKTQSKTFVAASENS